MTKELLKYWDGMMLFLANHGWIDPDKRAIQIRKLIEDSKPQKRTVTRQQFVRIWNQAVIAVSESCDSRLANILNQELNVEVVDDKD